MQLVEYINSFSLNTFMDHEGSTKVLTKYKVQYNTTNKGKTDRQRAPH